MDLVTKATDAMNNLISCFKPYHDFLRAQSVLLMVLASEAESTALWHKVFLLQCENT